MIRNNEYKAAWGRMLTIVSAASMVFLTAIAAVILNSVKEPEKWAIVPLIFLGPLISLFFIVRSYQIKEGFLIIQRLVHDNRIPLKNILSVQYRSDFSPGIRTFGNGGLFSFSGRYYNRSFGHYRAYVTDWKRAVLIDTTQGKFVISPDNPQEFVENLNSRLSALGR